MIEEIVEKVKDTLGFDANKRRGGNPHATFEQGHPAVNKDEPASFANPIESGAKKFSEEACGKPMPAAFDIQPGRRLRMSDRCAYQNGLQSSCDVRTGSTGREQGGTSIFRESV